MTSRCKYPVRDWRHQNAGITLFHSVSDRVRRVIHLKTWSSSAENSPAQNPIWIGYLEGITLGIQTNVRGGSV